MAPKKTKSKARRVRKGNGKRRSGVRKNVAEFASLSSKRTIYAAGGNPPQNFTTNTMYEVHNVQLGDYARALNVSKSYQFYRIKHVRITYKFPYDTYQSAPGGQSKPNFYYMFDKAGAIPLGINLEGLKAMGARPRQVDEKPISIDWAPSVLTVDDTLAGPLPAQYKISPWLSSDVPNVAHLGVFWYVDQMFAGGVQYQAEIEVQFEFKGPLWGSISTTLATGIVPAPLDDSPDGIVGGGDEANNPSFLR